MNGSTTHGIDYQPPLSKFSSTAIAAKLVAGARMIAVRHRIRSAVEQDLIDSMPVMISVHLPKTGGVAFRNILQAIYGRSLYLHYGRKTRNRTFDPSLLPVNTRCIHGHFGSDALAAAFPHRILITWVRHPVQRIVALYRHFLRNPDPSNLSSCTLHEKQLSLKAFADLDAVRNMATRFFLAGKRPDDFFFIGVTEHFDASIALFLSLMQIRLDLQVPKQNADRSRFRDLEPTESDLELLASRNDQDILWYEKAEQQFLNRTR
jgi:hypothetical protein